MSMIDPTKRDKLLNEVIPSFVDRLTQKMIDRYQTSLSHLRTESKRDVFTDRLKEVIEVLLNGDPGKYRRSLKTAFNTIIARYPSNITIKKNPEAFVKRLEFAYTHFCLNEDVAIMKHVPTEKNFIKNPYNCMFIVYMALEQFKDYLLTKANLSLEDYEKNIDSYYWYDAVNHRSFRGRDSKDKSIYRITKDVQQQILKSTKDRIENYIEIAYNEIQRSYIESIESASNSYDPQDSNSCLIEGIERTIQENETFKDCYDVYVRQNVLSNINRYDKFADFNFSEYQIRSFAVGPFAPEIPTKKFTLAAVTVLALDRQIKYLRELYDSKGDLNSPTKTIENGKINESNIKDYFSKKCKPHYKAYLSILKDETLNVLTDDFKFKDKRNNKGKLIIWLDALENKGVLENLPSKAKEKIVLLENSFDNFHCTERHYGNLLSKHDEIRRTITAHLNSLKESYFQ